jgi:hypothetical protein
MMRSIGFGARVVEGVSRLSLIISKKLVIVRFNSFRHLLHLMLRKCHLPREGGLGYFIDKLKPHKSVAFRFTDNLFFLFNLLMYNARKNGENIDSHSRKAERKK